MAVFAIKYRGHELRRIRNEAKKRGITVQAMLRAVVIPEWLETAEILKEEPVNVSGFVEPESSNDEHYNCKLLRERDKIAEQLRRRIESGSFYEDGLLLDLLTI